MNLVTALGNAAKSPSGADGVMPEASTMQAAWDLKGSPFVFAVLGSNGKYFVGTPLVDKVLGFIETVSACKSVVEGDVTPELIAAVKWLSIPFSKAELMMGPGSPSAREAEVQTWFCDLLTAKKTSKGLWSLHVQRLHPPVLAAASTRRM